MTDKFKTVEPVTVGGWYKLTDGRVGLFTWANGNVVLVSVLPGFAEVREARIANEGWAK